MTDFFIGFFSSITAAGFITVIVQWAWPSFKDKFLYSGIRIDGSWAIVEERDGKNINVGKIEFRQVGSRIDGTSIRNKTRDGKKSDRKFSYHGSIHDDQVTLIFEDDKGKGFDTGTYVFIVQNDCKTMVGMATFHGKQENKIVSESRTLKKVVS